MVLMKGIKRFSNSGGSYFVFPVEKECETGGTSGRQCGGIGLVFFKLQQAGGTHGITSCKAAAEAMVRLNVSVGQVEGPWSC